MAKNLLGLYAKISNEEADMLLNTWEDPSYWDYPSYEAKKHFDVIIFKDLKKTIYRFTKKYVTETPTAQELLVKMREELDG